MAVVGLSRRGDQPRISGVATSLMARRAAKQAKVPSAAALLSPLWKKAPLALVRFRPAFLAVVFAAAIVATTASAYPLFISSISSASIEMQVAGHAAWPAGLQVTSTGDFSHPRQELAKQERASHALAQAASQLPALRNGLFTRFASDVLLYSGRHTKTATSSLPIARSDVFQHVRVLQKTTGGGVWLTRSAAQSVDAHPGDHIYLRLKPRIRERNGHVNFSPLGTPAVRVRVAAIYQGLSQAKGNDDYWAALRPLFAGNGNLQPPQRSLPGIGGIIGHPNTRPPKEFMLATPRVLARLEHGLADTTRLQWNFPVDASRFTVEGAQLLDRGIKALDASVSNPTTALGHQLHNASAQTTLDAVLSDFNGAVEPSRQPAVLISVSGLAIALVICAAAGVFGVQRRRTETGLLLMRGVGPRELGVKAAIEAALPAAVGCVLGAAMCLALIERLGPGQAIEGRALTDSARLVAMTYVVACVIIGLAAGLTARRQSEVAGATSSLRSRLAQQPWEVGLLLLAGAAFYELSVRGTTPIVGTGGTLHVDALTLLFPLLAIAAGAGLAGRLAGRLLAMLRAAPIAQSHPSLYLAARRLSGAPRSGLLLITATTLSAGVLVYAGALTSSTGASERAKAEVFIGSDAAASFSYSAKPPVSPHAFPYPATFVTQMTNIKVAPSGAIANLVAIDPKTYESAAYWDDSFAALPLATMVDRLESYHGSRLPVITVSLGAPHVHEALEFAAKRIPITVTGSARLWPGGAATQPVVVTTKSALLRAFAASHTSLYFPQSIMYIKGPSAGILKALQRTPLRSATIITADAAVRQPTFLALGWTLGFLDALGVLIGSISLIGALLFGHARQKTREVSYSLARRMGLTRRQHRVALGLEFGGLLVPALIAACGLALLAAHLVYRDFDPMPTLPPPSFFRIPIGVIEAAAAGLLVVAVGAALLLQRLADRVDVAQLMRATE
jgi:putative ABC transport system permease protein